MNILKVGLVGSIIVAICFFAFSAHARLPEPDNIIYGVARENSASVTAKVNGVEIAAFSVATNSRLAPYYILRLPIDSLDPQIPGTARPGDTVEIFVDGEITAAATLTVGPMGEIIRLHLATEDSDDDGMLDVWEMAYFGSLTASDGSGDSDNDGLSDLEEFQRDADPTTKTETPPAPVLDVDNESLDFAEVQFDGSGSSKTLQVTNSGDVNLVIGPLVITGSDATCFSLTNDNCSGEMLEPGNSRTVEVVFTPGSLGVKTATLSIPSNDPETPQLVALTGTGVDSGILYVCDDSYCNGLKPCFSSVFGAYSASANGSEIRVGEKGFFLEELTLDEDVDIFLRGGWNADYSDNTGYSSTINGSLTISAGTVTVEGIVIEGPATLTQLDGLNAGSWRIRSWSDLGWGRNR